MGLQRCTTTDAFVVTDLDGAPSDGVVRWARKVLVDGARTLARTRTYGWALLGRQVGGASAGVNAVPEDRAAALAAFVAEVGPRVADGSLSLDPGKGVSPADLADLAAADTRPGPGLGAGADGSLAEEALAAGVVAAAVAALGGLDGRTVSIEGAGAAGPSLVRAMAAAGGRVVAVGTGTGTVAVDGVEAEELAGSWAVHGEDLPAQLGGATAAGDVLRVDADVLCCGSKAGLVDHEVAATLPHRLLVPVGPVPVTARGMAVATRRGIAVLPDFLTTAGALLASRPPAGTAGPDVVAAARDQVAALAAEALAHDEGPFLGAAGIAEAFLRTWRDELPFGRPLA